MYEISNKENYYKIVNNAQKHACLSNYAASEVALKINNEFFNNKYELIDYIDSNYRISAVLYINK